MARISMPPPCTPEYLTDLWSLALMGVGMGKRTFPISTVFVFGSALLFFSEVKLSSLNFLL